MFFSLPFTYRPLRIFMPFRPMAGFGTKFAQVLVPPAQIQSLSKTDKPTHIVVTLYYLVTMKPIWPMSMIQARTKIVRHITGGTRDRWTTCETHHGRNLMREIRQGLNSPSDIGTRKSRPGALRKVTSELMAEPDPLTRRDARLRYKYLVHIVEELSAFLSPSKSTVHMILWFAGSRA
jgi:hypothetical protein